MAAVAASVALGAVFLLAGGSKLASGGRWTTEARGLGAPGWAVPVVPWVELAVGGALVARLAVRPVAVVAAGMLLVFAALLALRLRDVRAGEPRPVCACFGAWSSRPIGWRHVARNALLVALAACVVVLG